MEQDTEYSKKKDVSNKMQLLILSTLFTILILLAVILVIMYINRRYKTNNIENLPIAFNNMLAADQVRDSTIKNIYDLVLDLTVQFNHFPTAPLSIQDMSQVTSSYGIRPDPITGNPTMHLGVDYRVKTGTKILAAADGVVTEAKWYAGYGLGTLIYHENGYTSFYGHLSRLDVSVGKRVHKGDVIALSGATGKVTGSHLHYALEYNDNGKFKKINPKYFTNTVTDSTYSYVP